MTTLRASSSLFSVLCGLDGEARAWRGVGGRGTPVPVLCSAADPQRAHQMAETLAQTSRNILSFGTAGGLAPDLAHGSLILGTSVVVRRHGALERIPCSVSLVERLQRAFPHAQRAAVLSDGRLLASVSDKRAAHHESGCAVVDMESGAVAQAAQRGMCAFAVMRVVLDPFDYALPPLVHLPLNVHGKPRIHAVLQSLIRDPRQIPDVVRMARLWRQARDVLTQSAPAILAELADA